MDKPGKSALLGRVARIRRLEGELRLAKARNDLARPRKDAPDLRNLLAAHQSVLAIIEFIDSSPDWEKEELSFAFHKLQLSLTNIASGRRENWLMPPLRKDGAPPKSIEIIALRGRYAAVMDFLIKKGGWREQCAGEFVTRHAGRGVMESLVGRATKKAPSWRAVQDWRQNIIGRADPSEEGNSFNAMREVIKRLGYGQSPTVVEVEAKKLLAALRQPAADLLG
jgi:hypothetical protein